MRVIALGAIGLLSPCGLPPRVEVVDRIEGDRAVLMGPDGVHREAPREASWAEGDVLVDGVQDAGHTASRRRAVEGRRRALSTPDPGGDVDL